MRLRASTFLLCLMIGGCASISPEDVQMSNALCEQGKTLLSAGKNHEARDVYASATTRNKDNARAWNGLGVSYDMLGKHEEAQDAYQRAVDQDPQDINALNNLAHAFMVNGNAAQAVELLQPYAGDPSAPLTVQQNLAEAKAKLDTKQTIDEGNYADLGSAPTEGMAEGKLREARALLGDDAKRLIYTVEPEVRVTGGVPVFTIKATGASPQDICDIYNAKAFPCVAHGK